MPDENVLVTGASSGIGLELARCFAESGSNLILVSRKADVLLQLMLQFRMEYGVEARALPFDLTDPTSPPLLFEQLQKENVPVHVLVNNAGFGAKGLFTELPLERQLEMIRLNAEALTHLTRLFLPDMLKRGRGGVLNVASTASFVPGPNMTVYHATKAYILSFTEGLAEELRGAGVTATCLAPGATDTEFQVEAGVEETWLFRRGVMTAEKVAAAGYRAFRKGQVVAVPGISNKAIASLVRFVPRALARKAAHFVQR
jgi:uncharacterized protein